MLWSTWSIPSNQLSIFMFFSPSAATPASTLGSKTALFHRQPRSCVRSAHHHDTTSPFITGDRTAPSPCREIAHDLQPVRPSHQPDRRTQDGKPFRGQHYCLQKNHVYYYVLNGGELPQSATSRDEGVARESMEACWPRPGLTMGRPMASSKRGFSAILGDCPIFARQFIVPRTSRFSLSTHE
ncbi:uncharacterized protein F5Z01DRAFT_374865 [Emericellopsis atlantica]|uniref:Uncharacterized protein n=1 Tax=Emericellopsis atlantica TaxID=2614577 RepID=A0A9P7ZF45_9HYPO|nr:uncharacterized protein F5Z01DRAFT_374865 [Emericellopsis atlantica]KAG9250415.1 hypothetical protein F5Z01DRAFT_374865 [Emericellopsis atlantica]